MHHAIWSALISPECELFSRDISGKRGKLAFIFQLDSARNGAPSHVLGNRIPIKDACQRVFFKRMFDTEMGISLQYIYIKEISKKKEQNGFFTTKCCEKYVLFFFY